METDGKKSYDRKFFAESPIYENLKNLLTSNLTVEILHKKHTARIQRAKKLHKKNLLPKVLGLKKLQKLKGGKPCIQKSDEAKRNKNFDNRKSVSENLFRNNQIPK